GIVPLQGQREALEALDLTSAVGAAWRRGGTVTLQVPKAQPTKDAHTHHVTVRTLAEHEGKRMLAAFGVRVPRSHVVPAHAVAATADAIGYPVVIKATGETLQHKSDIGGVVLDVRTPRDAAAAADRLSILSETLLVEQ